MVSQTAPCNRGRITSRRKKRTLLVAGLLAVLVVTVLISRLHPRGNPPGGDEGRNFTLAGHTLPVQALAFSPDGATLNSAAAYLAATLTGLEVATWEVGTGHLLAKHRELPSTVHSLAFAPGGRRLAATVNDREVVLWDVTPWRERARLTLPVPFSNKLTFSDTEALLALTDLQGNVSVCDLPNGLAPSAIKAEAATALAFAPGGTLLAFGATAGDIGLWNPVTDQEIGVLRGHKHHVFALVFSLDGRLLASGDFGGTVQLWDVATKRPRATLIVSEDAIREEVVAVTFAPDGGTLAVAVGREVQLWDTATGRCLHRLTGHEGKVLCLAYAPDGARLASGGYDGTVRLWDLARSGPMRP
jgi:WD40 repeat protein